MKLVTLARGPLGQSGAVIGSEALDFAAAGEILSDARDIPAETREILVEGSNAYRSATFVVNAVTQADPPLLARLRSAGALTALGETPMLSPLPRPRLVLSHGQAYHSHALDWDKNAPREKPNHPPAGFFKAQSAIIGSGAPIVVPDAAPDMVDFEGEFCLVFGRTCHHVDRAHAWDYVIGFTIMNDVSARDWIKRTGDIPGPTLSALNILYKNFPTFCPIGPNVTTKDELATTRDFHLTTRLNGEVMQDSWTRDLIWDIPELIEFYSSIVRFEPGDVLSTGTPGGVGAGRKPPVFMKPGDVCSVTVDGVGTLENPIIRQA